MAEENMNRCMHNDCFTCPYKDCISNKEPEGYPFAEVKRRKKLTPEEKRLKNNLRQRLYYQKKKREKDA
jgi:hypothetical protein